MKLTCPICGKEYEDQPGVSAHRRLQAHLTGRHCLSGDAYLETMQLAFDDMVRRLEEAEKDEERKGT